ncbi:hypothetical protein SKAU_G00237730 [Synaphobranchus kaupii]|uniref:Uncharacterized protein n=1 Tax=Synaphobranchus kaupii TaxID=118154 RepID=A0A9Q1F6V0_SYNKA|nr:hypothetical protein SKAU_G00237730 [Synaphobranchus kaupii]
MDAGDQHAVVARAPSGLRRFHVHRKSLAPGGVAELPAAGGNGALIKSRSQFPRKGSTASTAGVGGQLSEEPESHAHGERTP